MAAPAPVPALPDTERRTAYSISAQTGPFAVNFAIYGDSTDYVEWVEVWLNSVQLVSNAFTLTSPSGDISILPRPISDAVINLVAASSGNLQIVGARRPRRPNEFAENRGVPARDLNQVLTDVVAQNRESWDRMRTRMLSVPAGETLSQFPPAAARANKVFTFDNGGQPLLLPTVPPVSLQSALSVITFGAVGDDVTNNTAAFQAAINAANAGAIKVIYVPNGVYWFPRTSPSLDPGLAGITFIGDGRGSILHFDEGTTATPKSLFKCATDFDSNRGNITFDKIKFLGTLPTTAYNIGPPSVGGQPMFLVSFDRVTVRHCFFENINGISIQVYDAQHCEIVGNRCVNSGGNFVWCINTPDILCDGNFAQQIGDDFFDCGMSDVVDDPRKVFFRSRTVITNNICISGARVLTTNGARETIISNNIMKFTGGIAHQTTGHISSGDITIESNTIVDIINVHLDGTVDSAFTHGIVIEGPTPVGQTSSNNTIPTHYNTTTTLIEKPWNWYDDGGLYGSASANTPTLRVLSPTARVKIRGNTLARTAKAVANFGSYGLGLAARDGALFNSAVLETCFEPPVGIQIGPDIYDVQILDNILAHTIIGIQFEGQTNAYGFKNIRVAGNIISDCSSAGIDVRGAGGAIGIAHMDVIVEHNVIDGDPFRRASNSNVNGSYASDAGPFAFLGASATGLVFRRNTIRNVCGLHDMSAPANSLFEDNLVIMGVPAALGYNIGNKGVGNVIVGFSRWKFKFIDNDPTSATYQQFLQMPLATSASIPTTGWYPIGWIVWSTAPTTSLAGWQRLTTGSAHVLNTDWAVIA